MGSSLKARALIGPLLFLALACARPSGSSEHQAAMAAYEEVMGRTLDPSYASPDFDEVARLLRAVPTTAPQYESARALAQQIEEGRAAELKKTADRKEFLERAPTPRAKPEEPQIPAAPEAPVASAPASPASAAPAPVAPAPVNAEKPRRPAGAITLYVTSWCGYCKKARAFLRDKGVPFTEKDIEADPNAARECKAKREANGLGNGVPMIDVAGEYMVGFSARGLTALLEEKGFL